MIRNLILLFFSAVLFTCGNSENNTDAQKASTPATQNEAYLPSITLEEMEFLWNNCNQVDFIYYELPISTSLNDQYSIQQSLRHVSDTPVPLNVKNNCKPISRVFYKKDGDDLMEAEVYFSQGCSFFVFLKNGKPQYSNLMTDNGIKHFNDIIQKALSIQPQQ